MENSLEPTPTVKKSNERLLGILGLALIILILTGGGIYNWQHRKVSNLNAKVSNLHSQLKSATKAPDSTVKSQASDTFTYSPKTGGLSLTLPNIYGIIVNIDGNYGGAPGARFRVGSVLNSNTFSDGSYQGVQVDIGNSFTSLDHAVSAEESRLDGQRNPGSTMDRNYKVSDTTVAGLSAKLLTADGLDEYQGNIAVYIVGSGSFEYRITANGTQLNDFKTLQAVLKGISIKPVTF